MRAKAERERCINFFGEFDFKARSAVARRAVKAARTKLKPAHEPRPNFVPSQIFVHIAAAHFYYFRQLTQARFALQLLDRRVARARALPRPARGKTRQDERRYRAPTLRFRKNRCGALKHLFTAKPD